MKKKRLCALTIGLALLLVAPAWAADQGPIPGQPATDGQSQRLRRPHRLGQIYGSQLMTDAERQAYWDEMAAAKTATERLEIRKRHHALMVQRAKERGVTLPEEPAAGGGQGLGYGGGQ